MIKDSPLNLIINIALPYLGKNWSFIQLRWFPHKFVSISCNPYCSKVSTYNNPIEFVKKKPPKKTNHEMIFNN